MKNPLAAALALVLVALGPAQTVIGETTNPQRLANPALSPDGRTVVFSWQGDLFRVPAAGGDAERITVHNAADVRPVWFPDGSRIAFASDRNGTFDVYTMRPDGTDLRRITYDAGAEYPGAVSGDGGTIYGQTSAFGRGDLFRVPARGGDLVRLTNHPFETAYLPALSPDGKTLYYNRGAYGPNSWQKLRTVSAALPELWAADNAVPLRNNRRLTANEATDLTPLPASDGTLTFVSNREGTPNLWRSRADGKSARRLTSHTVGAVRNPSLSRDGALVAYEYDSSLYLLDARTGRTAPIAIRLPADSRVNPRLDVTVSTADAFDLSPDGRRLVVGQRGDLFLTLEKGGPIRRLTTNPGLDAQPMWLDKDRIVYVAADPAQNGKRVLMTTDAEGKSALWYGAERDLSHPIPSPDGKSVLFLLGDDTLMVRPVAGGEAKTLLKANLRSAFNGSARFAWSPDSRFVAVDRIQGRRRDVELVEVATGKRTVVARLVFKPQTDEGLAPVFLPNGRGLLVFSGEYENQDLFLVDLVPPETTFSEDELDAPAKERPTKPGEPPTVRIEEEGIFRRLRRLTTNGANAAAADARAIYAATPDGVVQINPVTGASTPLVANPRVTDLLAKGGKLYLSEGGRLSSLSLGGPPAPTPISFSLTYAVDAAAEQRALFEDVWWAVDRLYYDAKLNNKDWPAIRARYAAKVPFAYDRQDFYRMMGEMMEELDSSHLGATSPPAENWGNGSEAPAFLGADLDPEALARGRYVVGRVIPGSPASMSASLLSPGDEIVSVDGVAPSNAQPFASLLDRKAGRKVEVAIRRGGAAKTVTIKPLAPSARTGLEYEAWVEAERAKVDALSGGKLGYLHIRAMDEASLARFLREIRTEAEGKQGVVVDARFNGGGSTAVDILAVLIRTPWLVRTTRGEEGVRLSENIYRADGLELPTALLVNTASFSNAEVIAEGWRALKLGPIVGEKTPGYVIGTGSYGLWDGGRIRMPSIGAYAVGGENLEGIGRTPDVIVPFDPDAWTAGRDPQLERVVQELLKRIR